MVRHVSVHNEDPQLTFNLLGISVVATQVFSKGYACPFLKCPFTGLASDLYLHLTSHITLRAPECPEDVPTSPTSFFAGSSTLAGSTPSQGSMGAGLATPFSQLPTEPPNKKRRLEPPPSPTPDTTSSRPHSIPNNRDHKIHLITDFIRDHMGCCPLHSISSLPAINSHSILRHCDLIDVADYKALFRKVMRAKVNSALLCFSCCGYKSISHPIERSCDSDSLQDIWIGIPFLIFSIPALQRIIFGVLGKSNYHTFIGSMEEFTKWLVKPSPHMDIPTMATPNLFDVIIAFSASYQEFADLNWGQVLDEASRRAEL